MTKDRPMTDEQFAELLLKPHADTDGMEQAGNQQELRAMQAALGSYRHDTLHWAERRSAGQPSLAARARAQQRWAALPQWALAMVALVTIVSGVAHLVADRAGEASSNMAAALPAAAQPAAADDLAADNHLLSSIDAELSYHGGSPVDGLRLRDGRTAERTAARGATD